MVTMKKSQGQINEYYGLSTDTKPTGCPNGSIFYEMDTVKLYMFDGANQQWREQ